MELKQPGNLLYLVGKTYPELGGSHYYQLKGFIGKTVPKVRLEQAKKTMDLMTKAIDSGHVRSCHDLSEGGLAVASAEMAFSSGYGIELDLKKVPRAKEIRRNDSVIFSESNSRFLVEIPEKNREAFEALMKDTVCAEIGRVKKDGYLSVYGLDCEQAVHAELTELRRRWKCILGG